MTSIASIGSIALQILAQPRSSADPVDGKQTTASDLTAVASGLPPSRMTGIATGLKSPRAQAADALFDVSSPNITKLKMDLFKRTGESLGVKQSDFDSMSDYGAALKAAVGKLKADPNARQIIAGIEKDLGLDKLGISLDTVIDAIADPKSGADAKLTKALEKPVGADHKPASAATKLIIVQPDDVGLYGISNGTR